MKRIARYFFQGLIVLAPIALTAYVLYAAFTAIDGWLNLPVPGLGVAALVAGVTLIGLFANLVLVAPLLRFVERVVERLPFVKILYGSVKDLLSAVVGEERRFQSPVLVEFGGVEVIGFVTRDSLEDLGLADRVAVYVPQSYNFAGQTLIVSRDAITPLSVSGGDAMTFIISAGLSGKSRALESPSVSEG